VVPFRKVAEKVTPGTDDEVPDFLVRAKKPERARILFGQLERTPEGAEDAHELRAAWFARARHRGPVVGASSGRASGPATPALARLGGAMTICHLT